MVNQIITAGGEVQRKFLVQIFVAKKLVFVSMVAQVRIFDGIVKLFIISSLIL